MVARIDWACIWALTMSVKANAAIWTLVRVMPQ
jgi:hypothetical protein